MKFVLAGYGSRGDVEPCGAVGRELLRRGHDVCMAVPPDKLGFVESAGLTAVAYGPDTHKQMNTAMDFIGHVQNPMSVLPQIVERVTQVWAEKSTTLVSSADGADMLMAGMNEQRLAANVAEYYGIPLAAVHFFPAPVLELGRLQSYITKEAKTHNAAHLACPRRPDHRRDRWWRSRPTTSSACPGWQPNGRNWGADAPSSVR